MKKAEEKKAAGQSMVECKAQNINTHRKAPIGVAESNDSSSSDSSSMSSSSSDESELVLP